MYSVSKMLNISKILIVYLSSCFISKRDAPSLYQTRFLHYVYINEVYSMYISMDILSCILKLGVQLVCKTEAPGSSINMNNHFVKNY